MTTLLLTLIFPIRKVFFKKEIKFNDLLTIFKEKFRLKLSLLFLVSKYLIS